MRTVLSFTAFFLICLASHLGAQDLQVIKDSEAAQYVGKNVEVRGLVVAVYTSKKGNTFLNFGGKYPNQTFTGWIPPASPVNKSPILTGIEGKHVKITGRIEMYKASRNSDKCGLSARGGMKGSGYWVTK